MKTFTKKSLGQNFLRDPKILKKIADAAQITPEDTVIEIGPGEGTLTKLLLERAKKVICIEKDEALAANLKKWNGPKPEVITGDALEISPRKLLKAPIPQGASLGEPDYILVGNIPYYITGEIFRTFLENDFPPKSLTFVIQKEVADRIMTRDGKESMLSISLKAYGDPEHGGIIKAGSFYPAPKVDSAIISLRNINKERFIKNNISEKDFFACMRAGFAHKRKFLSSNLGIPKDIFDTLGIPEKVRAEELSIDQWFSLVSTIIHTS